MTGAAVAAASRLVPPPHPSDDDIERAPRRYWLFGSPISHSASPAFQNCILQATWQQDGREEYPATYALCDTSTVEDPGFLDRVRRDERFGGAGITMPLKVAVTHQLGPEHALDELNDVARAIGSVNTIVVVRNGETRRNIGTNTDFIGVLHAILRASAVQQSLSVGFYLGHPSPPRFVDSIYGIPCSAFVIGAGGACRSAILALHKLGLSPIYLLNRLAEETQEVVAHFEGVVDVKPLRTMLQWAQQSNARVVGEVGPVIAGVGCIPALPPVTAEEKMVYTLSQSFFAEPFDVALVAPTQDTVASATTILLPSKRIFLDMCYKPRLTPLLREAVQFDWHTIGGVEAMIEQGLAQARMWAASSKPLSSGLRPLLPDVLASASQEGDDGPISTIIEANARALAVQMSDIP
ncbi:NAD(P)-binding protein [Exidia glandulosa HHB12029]|uniref:NAD(P)-binding protein n=1 Tax=Exidia glandulosa HHB12029 TaxID=1314781 RepID=A0A165D4X5_EXIGL|nr:NAD(P)-binding protein [Exidia glandulosa HHB12029]